MVQIVIVGAGFGGLRVAKGLARVPAKILVIDKHNHHLFQPLLYQVATAALSPADIAFPIRSIFKNQKNTEVVMSEVTGVDREAKRLLTLEGAIPYDYLVLCTGAHYNYFGHSEWERHAPHLKSLSDATAIREKMLLSFELAEIEKDPARRKALLTFVFVGAGPTGVELAGAFAEVAYRTLARDFRNLDPKETRIILLDGMPRILGAFPDTLARKAEMALHRLGVEIRTGARVIEVGADGVALDGEKISAATVIWTAGVKASAVGQWLNAETDKSGRVMVQPDLSVKGNPEIFVLGDAACVLDKTGKPLPGVAPVAMQQGTYVARVIADRLDNGKGVGPFIYKDKGNLATIGRSFAIADFGWLRLSGLPAWLLWLQVHIFYLIGFKNRVVVFFQWAWAYATFQRGARLILTSRKSAKLK